MRQLWHLETEARAFVLGDALMVVRLDGFTRIDPTSGREMWRAPMGQTTGSPWHLVRSGDLVVALGPGLTTIALGMEDGAVRWRRHVDGILSVALSGSGLALESFDRGNQLIDAQSGAAVGPVTGRLQPGRRYTRPGDYPVLTAVAQHADLAVGLDLDDYGTAHRVRAHSVHDSPNAAPRWEIPVSSDGGTFWVDGDFLVSVDSLAPGGRRIIRLSHVDGRVVYDVVVSAAVDCPLLRDEEEPVEVDATGEPLDADRWPRWSAIAGAPAVVWQECGTLVRFDARLGRVAWRQHVGVATGVVEGEVPLPDRDGLRSRVPVPNRSEVQWVSPEGALRRRTTLTAVVARLGVRGGTISWLDGDGLNFETSDGRRTSLPGVIDCQSTGDLTIASSRMERWLLDANGRTLGTLAPPAEEESWDLPYVVGSIGDILITQDSSSPGGLTGWSTP